ncbi:MAG: Lpg1974 family pore-forming outer membrane protein [Waddliaceae bacterium]
MKKWSTRIRFTAIMTFLFASATVFANNECCPCPEPYYNPFQSCCWDRCPISDCSISVDFLWWRPSVDDLDYAADRETTTKFKYKHICPDWEPGVRVMFLKPEIFCGWDLNVSWTHIESTDSSSVSHENNIFANLLIVSDPPEGFEGIYNSAKGSWNACYQEWNALLLYYIPLGECHHFIPFFGLSGISLEQKLKTEYTGIDSQSAVSAKGDWHSDYYGIGFRFGSAYSCNFSNCMSFFFNASGAAIVGKFDSTLDSSLLVGSQLSELKLQDNEDRHMATGYHLGAGVSYDTCYCNYDVSFKLGYEIVDWFEIPNQENFVGSPDSTHYHGSSSSTRAFGFHGLTAGLAVSF